MKVEEFQAELFQDVLAEAEASGDYAEAVFFEKYCDLLTEAGELVTADYAHYRGPSGSGIRVDGYGGDPANAEGTLSLIISEFNFGTEGGRLTKTEMNQIFSRVEKFLNKALDGNWRNALEETSPAFGLADLIAQRWSGVDKVRMLLITNRELSDRVDGRDAGEIDGRTVTYSVWDIKRAHRFATTGHGREEIEIDLVSEFGEPLPLLAAHLSTTNYESYLAVMPGSMLAKIYDRWGARLLEQNVRVFLQARGNVNKGIRNTLENDPSMFFAYNNGITATAEQVETTDDHGKLMLKKLRNLQIVNGGQTTASIHMALRNKVDLSHVFVQMKLSIVAPDEAEAMVPRISEYANSQNRVSSADFFSNHPFHVRIEDFSRRIYAPSPDGTFRESKWFYERARGQFNDARSKLTASQRRKFDLEHPRSQLFSKTDLAKFLNVWEMKPDQVSLGAQKNFANFARWVDERWNHNELDFNEGFYRESVAKAIVFRKTEKIVSNQPWYEGGYRANIVAYGIAKLALDVSKMKKSVDFKQIWNRQGISPAMEEAIALVARDVHDTLVDPPAGVRNVTEWAKKQACWDRIGGIKVEWPERFLKELISSEERKERKREHRKDQQVLSGIEAQTAVFNSGGPFWKAAIDWGKSKGLLTEKEIGILQTAALIPRKVPTEKQSIAAMEALGKLEAEGFQPK